MKYVRYGYVHFVRMVCRTLIEKAQYHSFTYFLGSNMAQKWMSCFGYSSLVENGKHMDWKNPENPKNPDKKCLTIVYLHVYKCSKTQDPESDPEGLMLCDEGGSETFDHFCVCAISMEVKATIHIYILLHVRREMCSLSILWGSSGRWNRVRGGITFRFKGRVWGWSWSHFWFQRWIFSFGRKSEKVNIA